MAIESEQLALALVTGTAALQTVATVPAGAKWIVRTMYLRPYFAGAPTQITVAVETAGGVFAPIYDTGNEAAKPVWEGWAVMLPGDKLRAYAAVGEYLRILASGTVLPL